jgi:hypothetical protein
MVESGYALRTILTVILRTEEAMLTSVLLLASLVTAGTDAGPQVTAVRAAAWTATPSSALASQPGKKRQRRNRPQRSGMPWEAEDDAPDSSKVKGTFGSFLVGIRSHPAAFAHAIRAACLATAGTPLHLILHVLLI